MSSRTPSPTALIGVSGQAGALTEPIVREMAAHVERPIIFPLSNPTSRAEATPAQLLAWTEGRAIVSTGSPFPPVNWQNELRAIDQTNNSYIFPGFGLGVLASHARRVTDAMFMAAAKALADLSPARHDKNGRLLPPVTELRKVALAVAVAVAKQARRMAWRNLTTTRRCRRASARWCGSRSTGPTGASGSPSARRACATTIEVQRAGAAESQTILPPTMVITGWMSLI